ncbi:MAG: hypothetical protein IT290_02670 [Deltaproteobacteria bacterium]|nr:hypothetical protein [Deltaproteobacteria bacterium]
MSTGKSANLLRSAEFCDCCSSSHSDQSTNYPHRVLDEFGVMADVSTDFVFPYYDFFFFL